MTTETYGAHCSKAERSENVSEQSKGDLKREPKTSKIAAEIFQNLGSLLRSPFECRNTFSEVLAFDWCAPNACTIIGLGDIGVQTFKNGAQTPLKFTC